MNQEDLNEFINEESIRGDISREFMGIIADFKNGELTKEEKDNLIESVKSSFKAVEDAKDEEIAQWISKAAKVVSAIV